MYNHEFMRSARGLVFSLCVGFIVGFFFLNPYLNEDDDLLGIEKSIIRIEIGLIFAAIIGGLSFLISGPEYGKNEPTLKDRLQQIENKLNMFFSETECSNCQNKLQYPSNFTGQMQCKKCSSITNISQVLEGR